jgi:hypothetical protein
MTDELLTIARDIRSNTDAVISVHQLKFGCFQYSEAPSDRPQKGLVPSSLYADLHEALRTHPNVFSIQEGTEKKPWSQNLGYPGLLSGPEFTVGVKIPSHQQKFRPFGMETSLESFTVISTGSIFCAYADVHSHPAQTHFAQEFRELVKTALSNRKHRAHAVGPTPLHPEVLLVRARTPSRDFPLTLKQLGPKRMTVFVDEAQDVDVIAGAILTVSSQTLEQFYLTQITRDEAMRRTEETISQFHDLATLAEKFAHAPRWHIFERGKAARSITRTLSSLYLALVDRELSEESCRSHTRQFQKTLKDDEILSPMTQYFVDMCEIDGSVPNHLSSSLPHFEGYSTAYSTAQIAIASSLIGAAAGSIATALLTSP